MEKGGGKKLEKYVPIYPASNPSLSDIADPSQGLRRRPRALVKKVVFDEVQRFSTNSTMQIPACVKLEKI